MKRSYVFNKMSKTNGVFIIACICVLGLIISMVLSYFVIPVNRDVVVIIVNLLVNTVTAVVSYFMGASHPDEKATPTGGASVSGE